VRLSKNIQRNFACGAAGWHREFELENDVLALRALISQDN
jgi:hypothetical protein